MNKRGSGILLHITSLPSPYGIGDLGPWAYKFADFLAETKQSYWQVLPINPIDSTFGNSPYSSSSAFAGNTLLISPDILIEKGLLSRDDISIESFSMEGRCDYKKVYPYKEKLFSLAYEAFKSNKKQLAEYEEFCSKNSDWLEDFVLFTVIKKHINWQTWHQWEDGLKDKRKDYVDVMRAKLSDEIEKLKFLQFLLFDQWYSLKNYCNEKGVKLIGDIPIYVNYDSDCVWTNPEIFKLNKDKSPALVAGVPPDYFSKTGQLWGNPVYNWEVLEQTGFDWWIRRIEHNLKLFDILRIDHFRGFVDFWEVPATENTAVNGHWAKAPAIKFFSKVLEKFPKLPIIAEDLGIITDDVRNVMKLFKFPGMKVLLFAFGEDNPRHPYLPHNFDNNCVVYTGTHDNNTIKGWFEKEATQADKQRFFSYIKKQVPDDEVPVEFVKLAMNSIANTAIISMQDILGLGEEARMNMPSIVNGNWKWRIVPEALTPSLSQFLLGITTKSGRA